MSRACGQARLDHKLREPTPRTPSPVKGGYLRSASVMRARWPLAAMLTPWMAEGSSSLVRRERSCPGEVGGRGPTHTAALMMPKPRTAGGCLSPALPSAHPVQVRGRPERDWWRCRLWLQRPGLGLGPSARPSRAVPEAVRTECLSTQRWLIPGRRPGRELQRCAGLHGQPDKLPGVGLVVGGHLLRRAWRRVGGFASVPAQETSVLVAGWTVGVALATCQPQPARECSSCGGRTVLGVWRA